MPNSENNKRIAKNTILLYFRMFLTMGVSLYTSRIVLNILGIEDFGIYNVVGGVVMMFSFLNSSMSSATQRFLSFEIGKNDYMQLGKVFSMSVNIHSIIAFAIFILAETIGLWFLNAKLVIPIERIEAANWIYQFSILSFMITVMSVPYNATIIAHERMKIYAYVSIAEVVLKLLIVFVLVWLGFDKLKLYAILVFCVAAIIWVIYRTYCKRNFPETSYKLFWDKSLYRTMMSYAGWNLFGNIAVVSMNQGSNIILNLFFGPLINAARGIAFQVSTAILTFVNNFQVAINPQVIKSYSIGDSKYMINLVLISSKYSFFLLLLITLPMYLEMKQLLSLWLVNVPEYTISFTQLILIYLLIDTMSNSLTVAVQAVGKIKRFQIVTGLITLMNIVFTYFFFKIGFPPESTFIISIFISIILLFVRLRLLNRIIRFPLSRFLKEVIVRAILVLILSIILPLYLNQTLPETITRFFVVCLMSICSVTFSILTIGIGKYERKIILEKTKSIILHKFSWKKNN